MMRYYHQQPGDQECLRVCVASVFNLPLEAVPRFGHRDGFNTPEQDWDFIDWLGYFGIGVRTHGRSGSWQPLQQQTYLAYGFTERGSYHACVYQGNELLHDPHPDNTGLLRVDEYVEFVVEVPWKLHRLQMLEQKREPPEPITAEKIAAIKTAQAERVDS